MNSGLRKAHSYIWLLLALIVSVIIIFAVKDLAFFSSENNTTFQNDTTKRTVLKVSENDLAKASLVQKERGNALEVIVKSNLNHSSTILYAIGKDNKRGRVIGQLTGAGVYDFEIEDSLIGVIIYDSLKEINITKLLF